MGPIVFCQTLPTIHILATFGAYCISLNIIHTVGPIVFFQTLSTLWGLLYFSRHSTMWGLLYFYTHYPHCGPIIFPDIVHTVGPIGVGGKNELNLRSCYSTCLGHMVGEKKLKSIAFPCISTGIYGETIVTCVL